MIKTLPVTFAVTSDWRAGAGDGQADAIAATRPEEDGRPLLPASTVAGLFREATALVAEALAEGGADWPGWQQSLFGTVNWPAQLRFGPAYLPSGAARSVTRARSVIRIDAETGRPAAGSMRAVEVAPPTVLSATVELLDVDAYGRELRWTSQQREAARSLLAAAAGLIDRLGSGRFRGLGHCLVRVDGIEPTQALASLPDHVGAVSAVRPRPPVVATASGPGDPAASGSSWWCVQVGVVVRAPLLARAMAQGNLITGYDHVPGSMMCAWLHRALRRAAPHSATVRDAVVRGALLTSPATPELGGRPGLPVPLSYRRAKDASMSETPIAVINTLAGPVDPGRAYVALRSGFIAATPSGAGNYPFRQVSLMTTVRVGYEAADGPAAEAGLYAVQTIPAGMVLAATVWLRAELVAELPDLAAIISGNTRLGGKTNVGLGAVTVTCTDPQPVPVAPIAPTREISLWLTSDLIVRNDRMRPGTIEDLIPELGRHGVRVALAAPDATRSAGAARTRRIDGWYSGTDAQPRPSVLALRAGSCLRLTWDGEGGDALARLQVTGLGERRAEGFGRVAINAPHLAAAEVMVAAVTERAEVPKPPASAGVRGCST
jgi:CRISPR-associated protein Csx10